MVPFLDELPKARDPARDRPIIGIICIGINKSVFLGKSVLVSVCYSNAKIGIGIGIGKV